jgi:hypothetical protein
VIRIAGEQFHDRSASEKAMELQVITLDRSAKRSVHGSTIEREEAAMIHTESIDRIADEVMKGVVRAGVIRNTSGADDNVAQAVAIMRAEIKALIAGDTYADAREAIRNGALHEGYVIGLVIANCIDRIVESGAIP